MRTGHSNPPNGSKGRAKPEKGLLFQRPANDPGKRPKGLERTLTVADRRVPLVFQPNKRARRIILRLDHGEGRIVVVLPKRATIEQGRRFALLNRAWIRDRLDLLPEPVPFRPGRSIPYLGSSHRIRHCPAGAAGVWLAGKTICVSGRREQLTGRLRDWMKQQARREIERRAAAKAEKIGKRIRSIAIRDPRSRWGSCSPDGKLSFSWRLVFAPRSVIDYVVAHEVAHLRELNHSRRFWKLTAELTGDVDAARAWLDHHGLTLQRYGLDSA